MLIGICGGSGSGKTTLAKRVAEGLGQSNARRISFDSYYRDLSHLSLDERAKVNFDHPDSLDADLLAGHLDQLKAGETIVVPCYDFTSHTRSADLALVEPAPYVLVEGILLCSFEQLAERFDLLVFRRCDEATRFARRLERDVAERGRSPESVRAVFTEAVKPMHDRYVEAGARRCDLVVGGNDLDAAVDQVLAAIAAWPESSNEAQPPQARQIAGSQAPPERS